MRLQETKHLIIKLLQKRSDVPKRGRLTFAFSLKCLIVKARAREKQKGEGVRFTNKQ